MSDRTHKTDWEDGNTSDISIDDDEKSEADAMQDSDDQGDDVMVDVQDMPLGATGAGGVAGASDNSNTHPSTRSLFKPGEAPASVTAKKLRTREKKARRKAAKNPAHAYNFADFQY